MGYDLARSRDLTEFHRRLHYAATKTLQQLKYYYYVIASRPQSHSAVRPNTISIHHNITLFQSSFANAVLQIKFFFIFHFCVWITMMFLQFKQCGRVILESLIGRNSIWQWNLSDGFMLWIALNKMNLRGYVYNICYMGNVLRHQKWSVDGAADDNNPNVNAKTTVHQNNVT